MVKYHLEDFQGHFRGVYKTLEDAISSAEMTIDSGGEIMISYLEGSAVVRNVDTMLFMMIKRIEEDD